MATINTSIPHTERTQTEARSPIEAVTLSRIDRVNDTIRLLRLTPLDRSHAIKFLPGQWLDTYLPTLPNAGGFTLTSTPSEAKPTANGPGYLELAIQKSSNPPAQWFWKPESEILGSQLIVRTGGSFVWPPLGLTAVEGKGIERLVLVAGGVGVNPLVSIATQILKHTPLAERPREVHVLYTTRLPPSRLREEVLFYDRLRSLVANADAEVGGSLKVSLKLFFTNAGEGEVGPAEGTVQAVGRRIEEDNLAEALDGSGGGGAEGRKGTVAYVCGPPRMTDEFVEVLGRQEGMTKERVLCEKWW